MIEVDETMTRKVVLEAAHNREPILVAGVKYVPAQPHRGYDATDNSRASLLAEAGQIISGDRQKTYGDATEDFVRIANMWAEIFGHPVTAEQYARCMVCVKVSRLVQTPAHRDGWVDMIGYAALGGEIALGQQ